MQIQGLCSVPEHCTASINAIAYHHQQNGNPQVHRSEITIDKRNNLFLGSQPGGKIVDMLCIHHEDASAGDVRRWAPELHGKTCSLNGMLKYKRQGKHGDQRCNRQE